MFAKTFDCLTMKEKFAGIIYIFFEMNHQTAFNKNYTLHQKKKKNEDR